ncbi:MAG: hypothetical protein ABI867_00625 [Kofleriaceae bacterium]
MKRLLALAVLATATSAAAQAPCPACARGDELVDKLALQPLRAIAGELASLHFSEPVTAEEYGRAIELRRRTPALVRVGALDDNDIAAVATALCRTLEGPCTMTTWRALQCLADRCTVALPVPDPAHADVLRVPVDCRNVAPKFRRSAPIGVGFDGGMGYHRSRHPNDGHATSVGIEARVRLGRRLGTVARIDHISGRDEATDTDGNGDDDMSTGSITRISALAGPSLVFGRTPLENSWRYLRLDLLGGYISTRSQPDESGPAAGIDLVHQVSVIRFGLRFVQGFGDASDTSLLVAHVGIVAGAAPPQPESEFDCTRGWRRVPERPRSRLAIAGDFPLGGYGFSSELGTLAPGLGLELLWHLTYKLDALVRGDLLFAPGSERERTLHQAALAGVRIDHKKRSSETGFFTTLAAGYTYGSGISTLTSAGPIIDAGTGWGIESDDGAAFLRLHARFGLLPENADYRAIFLSGGFEIRIDPRRWRDRDRVY